MILSHTTQSGLTLKNIRGFNVTLDKYVNVWKHVDRDGVGVGPSYPTLTEALADTADYAHRAGWMMGACND